MDESLLVRSICCSMDIDLSTKYHYQTFEPLGSGGKALNLISTHAPKKIMRAQSCFMQ